MFTDSTKIYVKAGDGGDGAVAFRREKYVPAGGPDGGDGGRGGDVILQAVDNINTLVDLKFRHKFIAQNGEKGKDSKMYGKSAEPLIIKVPLGTVVKDEETGLVIKDMSDYEPFVIAKGGRGGWGNRHFATPTRQAPRFAKPGMPGEERNLILELKSIADVGLVGFPSVGKSTLISMCSAARPKIAAYHFTTLQPNLGVVRIDEEQSFVMADIPGIIEGASEGAGLGHDFLRHIERCRLILHIVDVSGSEGRDPVNDYKIINAELKAFGNRLTDCPQIVVGNKTDLIVPGYDEPAEAFRKFVKEEGLEYYEISAATRDGVDTLIKKVYEKVCQLPPVKIYEAEYVPTKEDRYSADDCTITKINGIYSVEGKWIANLMRLIDLDDDESVQYFQRTLQLSGIIDRLRAEGVQEGDTVTIYDFQFEFIN